MNKKTKKSKLTKDERKRLANLKREETYLMRIDEILKDDDIAKDRFSLLDTSGNYANAANIYTRHASKISRRKINFFIEPNHKQAVRLLLAYCAVLGLTPNIFIKAQMDMLKGFFCQLGFAPPFSTLIGDKCLLRIEKYLDRMKNCYEKQEELRKEIFSSPESSGIDIDEVVSDSMGVLGLRLQRIKQLKLEPFSSCEVLSELEMLARAGAISHIYTAFHSLLNNESTSPYLKDVKKEVYAHLMKSGYSVIYLSQKVEDLRNKIKKEHLPFEEDVKRWLL